MAKVYDPYGRCLKCGNWHYTHGDMRHAFRSEHEDLARKAKAEKKAHEDAIYKRGFAAGRKQRQKEIVVWLRGPEMNGRKIPEDNMIWQFVAAIAREIEEDKPAKNKGKKK